MMKKRHSANRWVFLLLLVAVPILGAGGGHWMVKAPGGSDADLEQNLISYYGEGDQPVEMTADGGVVLHAKQLDYQQKAETFRATGNVDMVKTQPKFRQLTGAELYYDSRSDDFKLNAGGLIKFGPEQTTLSAGFIEGNLAREIFTANANCRLTDNNGILTSVRMDGNNTTGLFHANEQVVFVGKKATIHSGTATYFQKENRTEFKDKPVVTQEDKVFTATEIIYDMKNNKIKALGPVQCIAPGTK